MISLIPGGTARPGTATRADGTTIGRGRKVPAATDEGGFVGSPRPLLLERFLRRRAITYKLMR